MNKKTDLIRIKQIRSIRLIAFKLAILLIILFTVMGILDFWSEKTFSVESLLSTLLFVIASVVPVAIISYYILKNQSFKRIEKWAVKHDYKFYHKGKRDEIKKRFNKSPKKYFFGARDAIMSTLKLSGPYAEGVISNRGSWFFISRMYSTVLPWKQHDDIYSGWCMEFKTSEIPNQVLVTRGYYSRSDTLDTESRSFEKLYNVSEENKKIALQLLDPVMIQLITESDICAIEFSNSSLVVYYPGLSPSNNELDVMFEFGMKIAAQVDRNFPLGKYEKK